MTDEVWRAIPEYEGIYEASNEGRVRSVGRVIVCRPSRTRNVRGFTQRIADRVMRPYLAKNGYYTIVLTKGGVSRTQSLHRLIALAFLGEPAGILHVNHRDGDKLNNRVENLEWVEPADNMRHAFAMGLSIPHRGSACPTAKLTEDEVREIRDLLADGVSQRKIASRFGVSQRTISAINSRALWAHLV